jgi:hypothetical protein
MNSVNTGHNETNGLLYLMTVLGTFLSDNWYLVIMVVFGLVHVYVAFQRHLRDKKKFELELKKLESFDN